MAATIGATGTIEPLEVVDVGAQVAGRVSTFGTDKDGKTADYGSVVERRALLAKIDDSVYAADLSVVKANVSRKAKTFIRTKLPAQSRLEFIVERPSACSPCRGAGDVGRNLRSIEPNRSSSNLLCQGQRSGGLTIIEIEQAAEPFSFAKTPATMTLRVFNWMKNRRPWRANVRLLWVKANPEKDLASKRKYRQSEKGNLVISNIASRRRAQKSGCIPSSQSPKLQFLNEWVSD